MNNLTIREITWIKFFALFVFFLTFERANAVTNATDGNEEQGQVPRRLELTDDKALSRSVQALLDEARELQARTHAKRIVARLVHTPGKISRNHHELIRRLEAADIEVEEFLLNEENFHSELTHALQSVPDEAEVSRFALTFTQSMPDSAEKRRIFRQLISLSRDRLAPRIRRLGLSALRHLKDTTILDHWILKDKKGIRKRFPSDPKLRRLALFSSASALATLSFALWQKDITPANLSWWISQSINTAWTYFTVSSSREFSSMRMQKRVFWLDPSLPNENKLVQSHSEGFFLGTSFILNTFINSLILTSIVGTYEMESNVFVPAAKNAALVSYCNWVVDRWQSALVLLKEKLSRQHLAEESQQVGGYFQRVVVIWGGVVIPVIKILELLGGGRIESGVMVCTGTACILLEGRLTYDQRSILLKKFSNAWKTVAKKAPPVCNASLMLIGQRNNE